MMTSSIGTAVEAAAASSSGPAGETGASSGSGFSELLSALSAAPVGADARIATGTTASPSTLSPVQASSVDVQLHERAMASSSSQLPAVGRSLPESSPDTPLPPDAPAAAVADGPDLTPTESGTGAQGPVSQSSGATARDSAADPGRPNLSDASSALPKASQGAGVEVEIGGKRATEARSGRGGTRGQSHRDERKGAEPNSPLTIQQALAAAAALSVTNSATPGSTAGDPKVAVAPPAELLIASVSGARADVPSPTGGPHQSSAPDKGAVATDEQGEPAAPDANGPGPAPALRDHTSSIAQLLTQPHAALGRAEQARPTAPDPLPTPGLPSDGDLQQLEQLVRDIAQISGTTGRAAFRLTAEQLGPLDVRLHSTDAGLSVTIRTHSEQSHATVNQAQHQLSDDMRSNGIKVASTSVTLGQGAAGDQRREHHASASPGLIEVAAGEIHEPQSAAEQTPAGRYA